MRADQRMRPDPPFVGRVEELRALVDFLEPAPGGSARDGLDGSAVIVASAGVGKTRLLREVLGRAETAGRPSVFAIATRAAAGTPYAALAQLAPESPADEHANASSWYAEVARTLRATPGGPPVVGVDDAHLLDPGSAALLLHLALTKSATLLLTVRRGEQIPDPITAMWKDGLARRMDLEPLSRAQIGELVDTLVPGAVAERAKRRIAEVSGGNALFARELVRGAMEAGALREGDGLWQWDGTVVLAPRLIDAVGARLADLTPTELEALSTVSMAEPLPLSAAETVLPDGMLATLELRGLVTVSDGPAECRVAHPLYGEVALDSLSSTARRRLLQQLIDAVAAEGLRTDADVVLVASGRLQLGQEAKPELLTEAAVIANRNFDHDLAARLADAAIHRGGGPPAQLAAAIAATGGSSFAAAEHLLAQAEQAISTDHHDLCLRYLSTRTRALQQGLGRVADALVMIERFEAAHSRASEHDCAARQLAQAQRAAIYLEDGRLADTVATAAPLLEDHINPVARLMSAEASGEALAYQGMTDHARRLQAIMTTLAQTGAPEMRRGSATAVGQEVMCLLLDGHAGAGAALAGTLHEQAVSDPDPLVWALSCFLVGASVLRTGRPASARDALLEATTGFRQTDISGHISWIYALLAQADALLGDTEAARRHLAQATDLRPDRPVGRIIADHVAAKALTRMVEGDVTGAADIALAGSPGAGESAVQRADLLHLAARLGAPPGPIAAQLWPLADQVEAPQVARQAQHVAALAAQDGEALTAVSADFAQAGAVLLAAEAAADAARAHRAAGLPSSARRLDARAAVLAARCEGARTPAMTRPQPAAGLSRREREVAILAARGLSNADIAERLSLSVRTVESHLYRVFAKLGVAERTELGELLSSP